MREVFVQELESVRQNLVEMGETTLTLLAEALSAIADPKPSPSPKASELEAQTDHQLRVIHDRCLDIITLQSPVASDARLVTGVLDAIVDLELIGDYSYELVKLTSAIHGRPPAEILTQVAALGVQIRECLSKAVDSWRNLDRAQALSIRPRTVQIRVAGQVLYAKLSELTSASADAAMYVDLMQVCKYLERIMRHAACVGDLAADAAPSAQEDSKAPATLARN